MMMTHPSRIAAFAASIVLHVAAVSAVVWLSAPRIDSAAPLARSVTADAESPAVDHAVTTDAEPSPASPSPLQAVVERASADLPASADILNHLWQSTVFTLVITLAVGLFRRNHARVRYWLWFAASLKFLVPFGVLTGIGAYVGQPAPIASVLPGAVTVTMARVTEPFTSAETLGVSTTANAPSLSWVVPTLFAVWACGFLAIAIVRLTAWRRVKRALSVSVPFDLEPIVIPAHVRVRSTPGLMEPGVVGIWRPIILMPRDIREHLTPLQLEAIVAHELQHIACFDNLTAAIQMVVEAVFWFHPVTWWIGGHLILERERACDEQVLRLVDQPRTYAEGIVNVCKRHVETSLACVSGVSGSDLQRRIELIMRNESRKALNVMNKLALAFSTLATIAAPVLLGMLSASAVHATHPATATLAFESQSVVPNTPRDSRSQPSTASAPEVRVSLRRDAEPAQGPRYALVLARPDKQLGPQLRRSAAQCTGSQQPGTDEGIGPLDAQSRRCGVFGFAPGTDFPSGRGGLAFRGLTMAALATQLTQILGPVIDETGLPGYYDGDFDFIKELPLPPPAPGMPNPFVGKSFASVFSVLPEQLGLRLEERR
jgi:beta-lactamase regulating signal transducer with metallopeptidase domain